MAFQFSKEIFIVYAKRTPIGSFQGALSGISAPNLVARLIKDALTSTELDPNLINWVLLGCVLQAGIGQAPARQAVIYGGLPVNTQAATINKVCSSGLFSVMQGATMIEAGQAECLLAGGMENMSQAPYYLLNMRQGARLGHSQAYDSIIYDGLWDVYNNKHMGNCAELLAKEFSISREEQDVFALQSYKRALTATKEGLFANEILPITVTQRKQEVEVTVDEEPTKLKEDKVSSLRPVFDPEGTVTAANASSINDGAALLMLCSKDFVHQHKLKPIASIKSISCAGNEPQWFTTAPISATEDILKTTGLTTEDIGLFEVNEAFSSVAIAYQKKLNLTSDKVNVYGGAVALGHPIGASGARILVTLINALRAKNKSKGIAAICNGGGEATAMLIEMA